MGPMLSRPVRVLQGDFNYLPKPIYVDRDCKKGVVFIEDDAPPI